MRCRSPFIVGAGSRHISMTTYRFDETSPDALADFPEWIVQAQAGA